MHAYTTHFSWKLYNVSCFSISGLAATVVTMLSCYVIKTLHHLQSNHDHLKSAKNKETISQSSILRCGYFIPLYISRLSPTTIAGLYLWDFLWLPYCKSVSEGFGSDWSNLKKLSFCFHFLKIFSLVWNATLIFFFTLLWCCGFCIISLMTFFLVTVLQSFLSLPLYTMYLVSAGLFPLLLLFCAIWP